MHDHWRYRTSAAGWGAVLAYGGLVCSVIVPVFVPSPTFVWQANLYESGFCSSTVTSRLHDEVYLLYSSRCRMPLPAI